MTPKALRTRYHYRIQCADPRLNGTTVSRVAESEADARRSILKVVREAASDATLRQLHGKRPLDCIPKTTDK